MVGNRGNSTLDYSKALGRAIELTSFSVNSSSYEIYIKYSQFTPMFHRLIGNIIVFTTLVYSSHLSALRIQLLDEA